MQYQDCIFIINEPAAFGRLCVETIMPSYALALAGPAAFGRLCVETNGNSKLYMPTDQPPSGGCVLKRYLYNVSVFVSDQPPSGGCVLKPRHAPRCRTCRQPAAFGRLCVETCTLPPLISLQAPAAFGRLCVETTDLAVMAYCR